MKAFIAALSLLTLVAVASSVISLRDHRHPGHAAQSASAGYPSGGWDRGAR